ncbi:MAG TPA: arginine deiminase-related protein [Candidatus Binatia bacterium]|nr:arginine deiminase-related protein [Candidatus Binatia bacterium]
MQILMCPPVYYGIEYEINPWMSRIRQSDTLLAQHQWRALYQLLKHRLNMDVSLIKPRPGLPDMVFTANAGLVWKNKFIVSNFRYQVRRAEATHFENWFAVRNYEIFHLPEQSHFEGEGDLLMCGDLLFAGYPIRSSVISHQRAAEIIGREVISLKLTNDWFYHLDTCLCPLSNDEAIYYPAAFDARGLKVLKDHIGTLIPVTQQEARRFACNAIVVEKNVIMNDGCPRIRRQLESLGFSVFEIPLAEFIKAGGSAKCLVLKVPHCDNETDLSSSKLAMLSAE